VSAAPGRPDGIGEGTPAGDHPQDPRAWLDGVLGAGVLGEAARADSAGGDLLAAFEAGIEDRPCDPDLGGPGFGEDQPEAGVPEDGFTAGRPGTRARLGADEAGAELAAAAAAGWEMVRLMAMSCPVPMFATDAVGRHVFVNPTWSELTGIQPDEALGWGWERAVHPHDLLAVTDQWGRAHGDAVWVRLRLLRQDGLHRAVILQAVPMPPHTGGRRFLGTLTPLPPPPAWRLAPTIARTPLGAEHAPRPGDDAHPAPGEPGPYLAASGPDPRQSESPPVRLPRPRTGGETPADHLGHRHRADDTQRRSPDHLTWDGNRRRASAPDGGDAWPDSEPRVPAGLGGEWRAAVALHGRAATSRPGEHAPDDRPAHGVAGGHGPAGGRGPAGGHGGGAGDGGRRPGRVPPGECGCLYGELARAEAACRDRERWLTSLLAELPAAVLLADAHSQIVGVNQAYCDLFDLAEAPVDLVGTDCRLLLRPRTGLVDDPAGFADHLGTLLRRRRTLRRETVMFADGRVFERSHLPLVSPDGYRGHLWLYVDVTDRRILDAEIEGLISEL
jgi:PAS domain S-box-containing protein